MDFSGNDLGTLAILFGLELVLGVDNVLMIAIMVAKLPENLRKKARVIGLSLALLARLVMLAVVLLLAQLENPLFSVGDHGVSVRDLILLIGGLYLLFQAVREIHAVVELKHESAKKPDHVATGFKVALLQIVGLDLVFSVDSVITAVGLTQNIWVIIIAVVLSFGIIMFYAGPVGEFILKNPSLKILALAFLITIGITIFMEGLHKHVEKPFIYLPMGFALGVELLQMRYYANKKRAKRDPDIGPAPH